MRLICDVLSVMSALAKDDDFQPGRASGSWRYWLALTWLGVAMTAPSLSAVELGLTKERPAAAPFVETPHGFMVPYQATIPGTDVTYEMVPIPGGTFSLGSPSSEPDRSDDEGPQVTVHLEPFWIGKYEITWAEYKRYMATYNLLKELQAKGLRRVTDNYADAVTVPTPLYEPTFTFELGGEPRQPAVTMSHFAARQYTKWLSLLTTRTYRLPTEAEWEYACRAGTTTAYSFGDDPSQLGEYGWFYDNSDETYHDVGTKKANPWGLHDMHGNVAELTLDQYQANAYPARGSGPVQGFDSVSWTTKPFPHVIRGGNWSDDAKKLRSAARSKTEDWREIDPNLPKSPWWFTDEPARGVGFRIVRSLARPADEILKKCWDIDNAVHERVVVEKLNEGRGVLGTVDPQLLLDAPKP